ncbi:MAG: tetratricopeptide repeat protein, partial [Candidatus Kapabacteria bacterium]|nr:tetratricopeptide repeat protein [Candidatus Kapabacteria bacterium]
MRKVLLVLTIAFVIFNSQLIFAQLQGQAIVDSLLKELPKMKEDTNKVSLLQMMSFQYNSLDPELGVKYGHEALDLAQKLGWQIGIAKSYNSIGGNLFALGNFDEALENFKKSLKLNEENKDSLEI